MSSSNGCCPGSAPVGVKKVASVPKRTSTVRFHTCHQAKGFAPFCVSLTKVRSLMELKPDTFARELQTRTVFRVPLSPNRNGPLTFSI
jgi:hypothetical protein